MSTGNDQAHVFTDRPNIEAGIGDIPLGTEGAATIEEVANLKAEVAEIRDRWMRSEAEIANVRTRAKRDLDDARHYSVQKFAADVVEAAENLRRGLDSLPPPSAHEPESIVSLRNGLVETERGFVRLLERNGIKREDPTGSSFDPNRHQAMSEQESTNDPAGTVLHTLTPAWSLNGRLLKPAMVVVSRAPSSPTPAGPSVRASS